MRDGDPGPGASHPAGSEPATSERRRFGSGKEAGGASGWVIETVVNPFHCLYQDALHFHTQSKLCLARSESEASRTARAALLLYVSSAEALVHQAAVEIGRPDLAAWLTDPSRPIPLADAWRLLPAIAAEGRAGPFDPEAPPWPQFTELLALRTSWAYPGPARERRAVLPLAEARRRLRAARTARGPTRSFHPPGPPQLPQNRSASRPLRFAAPPPGYGSGHPRLRH